MEPAELLRLEGDALLKAAERLDRVAFERAITLVEHCTGKVILTGAGTSGIIARKVAATLTSTGTPSLFLHPSDALHGGLGAVSGDDVLVAVSNSGETGEVLALLPYLRNRGVPVIAVVGNLDSTLSRQAAVILDAGAEREICPLNLAPTSTTTVAVALGDALAITLLQRRGLTAEAFALNHPSGRLGRRLTLRVADLMHGGDRLPAIPPSATWIEMVSAITEGGLGAVVVLDAERQLLGIVTDGDVRRAVQKLSLKQLAGATAEAIMTSRPTTVASDVLAYDALQVMEDRSSQISVLPVVAGDGTCVGLLRVHDIVRAGV